MHNMKNSYLQTRDGIRDIGVTGVQTCALPICTASASASAAARWRSEPTASFSTTAASRRATFLSPGLESSPTFLERKSEVKGKSVDPVGTRIIKNIIYNVQHSICISIIQSLII